MLETKKIEELNKFKFFTYDNKSYFIDEYNEVCKISNTRFYGMQLTLGYEPIGAEEFKKMINMTIKDCYNILTILKSVEKGELNEN